MGQTRLKRHTREFRTIDGVNVYLLREKTNRKVHKASPLTAELVTLSAELADSTSLDNAELAARIELLTRFDHEYRRRAFAEKAASYRAAWRCKATRALIANRLNGRVLIR